LTEFEINGKKIWFDVPYGGAMLSEYIHYACLFGSKKNILVGTCGGLAPQANACDAIIPTWSYGDESSTRMYSPENKDNRHFPDSDLGISLKKRMDPKIKVWEGPTVTCQAMLAETWEDVQTWTKEGYLGVEMEASTLFSVSSHFKVPSAALLIISDNLIKEETILHENYLKTKELRRSIRKEFLKISIKEVLEK
jgi:purine-nucleoside phosphorylase